MAKKVTTGMEISQINEYLGFLPEETLSDAAISRLRAERFLDLYGKLFPESDDEERATDGSAKIAQVVNDLRTFADLRVRSPNFSDP